jgi:polar amino acid transport system substrate-binding protein
MATAAKRNSLPLLPRRRRVLLSGAAALTTALVRPARGQTRLAAWHYYQSAPFELPGGGLLADLTDYLNRALEGRLVLTLNYLPRPRLNMMLQRQADGVIVLAPSTVFTGPAFRNFLWSLPIMADRQELLSLASRPVEYTTANALAGLEIGAIRGHNYPALQVAQQNGRLSTYALTGEQQMLDMLLAGRLDAITMATTSADYLLHQRTGLAGRIHRSRKSLDSFTRHLLFTPGQHEAQRACDAVLRKARGDPAWHDLFRHYGLSAFGPQQA